ncbi:hypothetical protein LshimejAT787_0804640 [Lyophyllum shimeji]|uniref:Uncharacterized protein n=1 Tax=Lyophyllum shimeji TaxID=47721 RepID=A0A9P3PS67_LYOSH|nr:hypothetical protein LshimejAT787_0804640 [Lyophyllum shimeji]
MWGHYLDDKPRSSAGLNDELEDRHGLGQWIILLPDVTQDIAIQPLRPPRTVGMLLAGILVLMESSHDDAGVLNSDPSFGSSVLTPEPEQHLSYGPE